MTLFNSDGQDVVRSVPLMRADRALEPGLTACWLGLIVWGAAGLCTIAVLLGRTAPGSATDGLPGRTPAEPLVALNYCDDSRGGANSSILDPETGRIQACTLAGAQTHCLLGFSPWRDGDGQCQLLALKKPGAGFSDEKGNRTDESFRLIRYSFPACKELGEVALDFLPRGPACWFPDRSDRILLVGGDHRLHACDLGATRDPETGPKHRPLRWETPEPGVGPTLFQDLCWSGAAELRGRLLVSACIGDNAAGPYGVSELWSLMLDLDRLSIAAADPVMVPGAGGAGQGGEEERMPCVGVSSEGRTFLAYLGRSAGDRWWNLWVAPIAFDGPSRAPRVVRSARRRLAENCVCLALAFSGNGRTIHVSLHDGRHPNATWGRMHCFSVPADM
jgi:hypothetical protein